jgi:hypothetical protein
MLNRGFHFQYHIGETTRFCKLTPNLMATMAHIFDRHFSSHQNSGRCSPEVETQPPSDSSFLASLGPGFPEVFHSVGTDFSQFRGSFAFFCKPFNLLSGLSWGDRRSMDLWFGDVKDSHPSKKLLQVGYIAFRSSHRIIAPRIMTEQRI